MKICGIEIKGFEAIVIVIDDHLDYLNLKIKKFSLKNEESAFSVQEFYNNICEFILEHGITVLAIKKRLKKGKFAGGPISFKIEALLQLCPNVDVQLFRSVDISNQQKKKAINLPINLKKYQEQAYLTACYSFSLR